jgi:hypothetical protein
MAPKTDATRSKAGAKGSDSASASTLQPAARAAELDHVRGDVGGGDLGAEASSREREVAVAGGDVEDFHAGRDAGGGEVTGWGFEESGEAGVIALRPQPLGALLDPGERVGRWRCAQL